MARRLRLRTKLFIWLAIAGVVPLVVAVVVSLQIIGSRLRANIKQETDRSLRIGLNLILDRVQRIAADAGRLGRDPAARQLFRRHYRGELRDPKVLRQRVADIVDRYRSQLALAEISLSDRQDRELVRQRVGQRGARPSNKPGPPLFKPGSGPVRPKNRYLQRVDIVAGERHPVIRALAPVVDDNFTVLGTVVVTVPFDHRFAESIQATLGLHVGFCLGKKPVASSFLDSRGRRRPGLSLSAALLREVLGGGSGTGVARLADREYSVGALPLVNARQEPVGVFYVALDRRALETSRSQAFRSLFMGVLGVLLLAVLIATLAAQGLARPLTKLHGHAMAVAKGDLEGRIDLPSGDELGDLGQAFDDMTLSLRENQERLAARISEIVTLHNISRAVTTASGLEEVLYRMAEEIREAVDAQSAAILLSDEEGRLAIRASWGSEDEEIRDRELQGAAVVGELTFGEGRTLCLDRVEDHTELGEAAREVGLSGSVMGVPLSHKDRIMGVLVIHRSPPAPPFGEAELRLLATFADQASAAIDNARLYEEVTRFNERLEGMVEERTSELTRTNAELAQAIQDLQETQSQLLLSERLAGLGSLVAGIAHEVNTPAAAIGGAVDNLDRNLRRVLEYSRQFANLGLTVDKWNSFMDEAAVQASRTELRSSLSPADARQQSKELAAELEDRGVSDSRRLARRLVDLNAAESALRLLELVGPEEVVPMMGCLQELTMLRRNATAIGTAISTINRIVTALRAYSHLDQTRVDRINLHDGIETTLIILASRLKHEIKVTRRYGELPPMPVYVDELNQVWTNLLLNASDSIDERGEIVIETEVQGDCAVVRIIDDGPGIAREVLPRIFKPFFTTKPKGKGTGLGLGIVQRIVDKHGGRIEAESAPGRTCFAVSLPISGPPVLVAEAGPVAEDASGPDPE